RQWRTCKVYDRRGPRRLTVGQAPRQDRLKSSMARITEGTTAMSKYVFANAEHTLVKRVEDGATFEIERHQHPSNVHGFIAEQWRAEGCPTPAPYKAPEPVKATVPDDQARARRRAAGDHRRPE